MFIFTLHDPTAIIGRMRGAGIYVRYLMLAFIHCYIGHCATSDFEY